MGLFGKRKGKVEGSENLRKDEGVEKRYCATAEAGAEGKSRKRKQGKRNIHTDVRFRTPFRLSLQPIIHQKRQILPHQRPFGPPRGFGAGRTGGKWVFGIEFPFRHSVQVSA